MTTIEFDDSPIHYQGADTAGAEWQATAMLPRVVDELVGRYLRQG